MQHLQTAAQLVRAPAEFFILERVGEGVAGLRQVREEGAVGHVDVGVGLLFGFPLCLLGSPLQRLAELFLGPGEPVAVRTPAQYHHQLVAQRLTQLLADFDGGEIPRDFLLLLPAHLHDAEQPEQQTEQRDCHQRRDAEEQTRTQRHRDGQVHKLYCLRLR
ncbi:hypothetical protein D3C81_1465570 [compost metagenome]